MDVTRIVQVWVRGAEPAGGMVLLPAFPDVGTLAELAGAAPAIQVFYSAAK